jgi:glycosyltransferase involved in cell wall biosynthesis
MNNSKPSRLQDVKQVSVIIPTYNGSRYLLGAVKSVLDQNYPDMEIIVVDDGSTEDICSVLDPFLDRIIYLRQDNAGVGAARNMGIRKAKGKYVAFLDDDDLWLPGNIKSLVQLLDNDHQCALAYSYPTLIDENGEEISNERPSRMPSGDVYLELLRKNRINTASVTMLRRSILEEVGYFNTDIISEDWDLWLRIARKYRVLFCDKMIVCYRIRSNSLSKKYDRMLDGHVSVVKSALAHQGNIIGQNCKKRIRQAAKWNLNEAYSKYAFLYYYDSKDREKARSCLSEALKICPFNAKNIVFFLLFSLPQHVFDPIVKIKRLLARVGVLNT